MRNLLFSLFTLILLFTTLTTQSQTRKQPKEVRKEKKESKRDNKEENEEYDNPMIREQQAADLIKDPALGYVPYQRLQTAIDYTEALKSGAQPISATNPDAIETQSSANLLNVQSAPLPWIERGPIYDSVGPSNGNTRGGPNTLGGHTSGRMRAFLLDTLNDPSGNTAFVGGVAGGIWKCTNFLSTVNNWTAVNDRFDNIAISSICQDPTNPQVIYFATGEPTSNADAVFGGGVWKSTNGGTTFSLLASTINYKRTFKIGCDAAGNVYLACRITTVPVSQTSGLFRSTNGGASWTDITPNNLTTNNSCTDFEFTSSGILNATFGYLGTVVNHRYSTTPVTVAVGSWSTSAGFRTSNTGAVRTEMAVVGNILYAVTISAAYNVDSCYKSIDGGINWTKQNTGTIPAGLGSGQGWYSVTLAINPLNTTEIICGGLDAYRSLDGGATFVRSTFWVTTSPYVHADHHFAYYWISGAQVRLILGTDGGIFYSDDNGITYTSKNRNIAIKQFYSAAIHPAAGSPYLLAGAQDNGTHSLSNPGLSYSIEVTGGDGCIVHINQQNPQIQYGSYVYNQYRRSTNGGATWSSVNLSGNTGQFVNPFDYDDAQNIMYCGNTAGSIRRWDNANTSGTSIVFNVSNMSGSLLSAKYSPYTSNRLFFGTNNGKLFRLDNANVPANAATVAAVDITGASFPSGTIKCINTGTSDDNLVATYTNYGVNNVWISSDGGTSWTAIDGDLPDMPVRWAMFEPNDNSKLFLATEAGIFTTTNINGSSTQWLPETNFPTVATYMLKMRASDSTIVAGTHGRGLWTAKIPPAITAIPSVTINQAAAQPDPTSVTPINFTIIFSEPVTGFTAAGVTLAGTAGATTKVVTGSGATYNVAVSGMTGTGTVIAIIPANVATGTINVAGNAASTSTDNTVMYNVVVGCTSVNPVPSDTVCNGSIHPAVNFTSPTPGTVFNWTNSTPSIGLGASGSGNIPAFTATNVTTTPVVATITVTPSLPSSTTPIPELLYYKFDGSGTTVPNLASAPPTGTATATIVGNQTQSGVGQCGTALESTGGTTNYLNTGWATSLNGPFTLSLWLGENQVNNNPSYLFGDNNAGAFRAFYGGAALTNNMLLRGGSGDVLITGVNPGATLVTIVYNGTNTMVYKNGVFFQTYAVTYANTGVGPFKVGGYGTGANNSFTGKLDEFRLYNRALSAAEVGTLTNCIAGCTGTPRTFTLSVNPTATVTAVSNQVVCNNASTTSVNFTSPTTGGTIIYNWTNNAPGIGLAATGTGNIASFVATNAGTAPITATITVTPTFTNGSVSCAGTARTFTITVNPTPTVNAVADQTVCVGAFTTAITFSGAVTGTIFTWTNSNPAIGLGASGAGNIPSFVATNGTTGAIAGTITVTPNYGTTPNICSGTPRTFTITVNPLPTLTCPGNISVTSTLGLCSAPVTYTVAATGSPIPVVTYTFSGATTGSGIGTGSGALFNVGVTAVTITATNTCAVRTCSFTVTVLDGQLPVITVQPVSKTFCEATNATFTVTATNALSYQWEMYNGSAWVPVAGATTATLTINNITQTVNTNTFRVRVIGLCTSVTSANATLYVDPKPGVSIVSTQTVLVPGSGFTLTAVTTGAGTGTYVWYRNGAIVPGVTGNILTGGRIDDRATYKVTYTNLNGCTNTSADFIVGTLQTTQIFVYPNPSRGLFQIRFYNLPNEQATVYIYNAAGQIVFKRIIPTGTLPYCQMPVNISNMAGGTYIIKLIDGAGKELGNTKIIKQ